MKFQRLRFSGARSVLRWRAEHPECFRTPYEISFEEQRAWFESLSRSNTMRFWQGLDAAENVVSVLGLTHIEWENSRAQISLVVGEPGNGYGRESFEYLFWQAFNQMGLWTVYAEVYTCNPFLGFWEKMAREYDGISTTIVDTKYYNGRRYDSLHITFRTILH